MEYLLFLGLLILPFASSTTCYFPNGEESNNAAYQPCPNFEGVRMCCATNRQNPPGYPDMDGLTRDICLPNGLCLNIYNTTNDQGELTTKHEYWRDLCTSDNWSDGGCVKGCVGDGVNQSSTDHAIMTPCDASNPNGSTTWCCGETTSCCGTSQAVGINPTLASYVGITSNASSTSITSSSSSTGASNQASQSSSHSPGLSNGAKAGIGIGIAAGAIAVLAVLAFIFLNKRKNSDGRQSIGSVEPVYAQTQVPHELNASSMVYEMPGSPKNMRHELQVDSGGRW